MSTMEADVGKVLLEHARRIEDCSAESLDKLNCIRLESVRSDGVCRAAHRCILEIGSEVLANQVARARTDLSGHEQTCPNVLQVDASIEVLDVILEYLYTRGPVQMTPENIIELYAVAKRFDLSELAQHVEEFLLSNPRLCIESGTHFWSSSNVPEDVEIFIDILDTLRFDDTDRFSLMQHVQQWNAAGEPGRTEVANKLFQKLLSQPPLAPATPKRPRWKLVLGVVGQRKTETSWRLTLVSMTDTVLEADMFADSNGLITLSDCEDDPLPRQVLPEGTDTFRCKSIRSIAEGSLFGGNNVLFNRQLYNLFLDRVHVADPRSMGLYSEIDGFQAMTYGMCAFGNESVFFYTTNKIYAYDVQRETLDLHLSAVGTLPFGKVFCLEHDSEKGVFALQRRYNKKKVWIYETEEPRTARVEPCKSLNVPERYELVGAHDKLLYFVSSTENGRRFYVALRDEVEVKRRYFASGNISGCRVFNGLLSCILKTSKDEVLLVIDLNKDTMLFKRPVKNLQMDYLYSVTPVIGEDYSDKSDEE